ncbi:hypothetical protein [Varunaivibrio sulfuroxidans]|uniref:Uncharacterized protein n=1 Tax=Varunaivibrio sulfuroxidans TaxID=1773489 RepID=A0A4R3J8G4_9PROT|nr:hypothetical protein [Varunaivibrio sulfuroxidans]TCS62128.1 hypothetical protein EDD55_10686 [Varunaivibrio sulfuroxidans]WES30560.1 hypothetical protein P3M64_13105 [Varunaivibrio sulfuroxidans]
MTGLRLILRELFSMFVDDVSFSLAIVAWTAFLALVLLPAMTGAATAFIGVLFFLGCAAILMISTWRAASKTAKDATRQG